VAYTCFVSYNDDDEIERAVAYRLQALALASEIRLLLPKRDGAVISMETRQRIDASDSVITFLSSRVTAAVREELAYAQARAKLIIPIRSIDEKGGAPIGDLKNLPWIDFNPRRDTPGSVETRVLEILRRGKTQKDAAQAILLVALGVGLLALMNKK
jgi:hypothetical protein